VASPYPNRDPKVPVGIQVAPPIEEAAEFAMMVMELGGLDPSYEDAKKRDDWPLWKAACDSEYQQLVKNGTWDLQPVERPKNKSVVDNKWVMKLKMQANGEIDKYKAHVVAKGYLQKIGVDYHETYAPVAKMPAVRTVLGISARRNWIILQFDFNGAFLNGIFEDNEEIYMEQIPDYEVVDRKKYVLRL
jgi:hypothetical protein